MSGKVKKDKVIEELRFLKNKHTHTIESLNIPEGADGGCCSHLQVQHLGLPGRKKMMSFKIKSQTLILYLPVLHVYYITGVVLDALEITANLYCN